LGLRQKCNSERWEHFKYSYLDGYIYDSRGALTVKVRERGALTVIRVDVTRHSIRENRINRFLAKIQD
jgi:hypothetical protein